MGVVGVLVASHSSRSAALDGLRGWAALSVVFFHLTWETFGVAFPVYRSPPLSFLGNGNVAVAIFFVLSGYVLTLRRWHRPDNRPLALELLRRYVRLSVPVAATVALIWLLMTLRLTPTLAAAQITHVEDWLGKFADFEPDPFGAVLFALVRVYWISHDSNYGPFLWTMIIELWGSFVVLILSHSPRLRRVPYAVLTVLVVVMLLYVPIAASVPAGAMIALLQRDGYLFRGEPGRLESRIATSMLLVALLAAGCFQILLPSVPLATIMGVAIFISTLRSRQAQTLLSARISVWLGRVSFPLYLVQYAVLITATSGLIIVIDQAGWLTAWSAGGIALLSAGASLAAAWAFLPVESYTLDMVRRMAETRSLELTGKAPS